MFPGLRALNPRKRDILDGQDVQIPEKPARLIDVGQCIKRTGAAKREVERANCSTPRGEVLHTGRGRYLHGIESLRLLRPWPLAFYSWTGCDWFCCGAQPPPLFLKVLSTQCPLRASHRWSCGGVLHLLQTPPFLEIPCLGQACCNWSCWGGFAHPDPTFFFKYPDLGGQAIIGLAGGGASPSL